MSVCRYVCYFLQMENPHIGAAYIDGGNCQQRKIV
jgi:hypothetical protein